MCFAPPKKSPLSRLPRYIKFKKSCCFDFKKISQVPCFNNHFIFFILKIAKGCETISSQQKVQVSCLKSIFLSHFFKGYWMGIFWRFQKLNQCTRSVAFTFFELQLARLKRRNFLLATINIHYSPIQKLITETYSQLLYNYQGKIASVWTLKRGYWNPIFRVRW